jgi:hypothetical protein
MLIIRGLPELLMEVSAYNPVNVKPYGKCEIIIDVRFLWRTLQRDLLNSCPASRVLFDNRLLQIMPT